MICIYKGDQLTLQWTVKKGMSDVNEDFSKALLKIFVVGSSDRYPNGYKVNNVEVLSYTVSGGVITITIAANTLPVDVYSLKAVWFKNTNELLINDSYAKIASRSMSVIENAFSIVNTSAEATEYTGSHPNMTLQSMVASYGYDGMSNYEEAVLLGKTILKMTEYVSSAAEMAAEEALVQQAEALRVTAESGRVTAESGRVSAETARVSAETSRVSAENSRVSAESGRVTAERSRADAEGDRVIAELTRLMQETMRADSETSRVTAENNRVTAESRRVIAETTRETRAASDHSTAASDHTTATSDHSTAQTDHSTATSDHSTATTDHSTAQSDHGIAESDHSTASTDHTNAAADRATAASDHTQATTDHSTASTDHSNAASDHTTAGTDHTTAQSDHTTAGTDHTTAQSDHTTAGTDHTQAESDHTRAESDHVSAVLTTAQTLTDAQKSQARTNIAALAKAVPTAEQGSKEYLYSFAGTDQNTDIAVISDMRDAMSTKTDKMVPTAKSVATLTGDLDDLDTTEKTDLVDAINEVNTALSDAVEDIEDGTIPAGLAGNLTSWAQRSQHEVIDEWSDEVRTTAGSLSIDSSKSAYILHIESRGAFKATSLSASGENLLNPSAMVGSAYVFQVPKLLRGSYGTADEANGILFVDSSGNNLHPTVRWSESYPTSASAGTVVSPYQFSGHSEYFYPSSGIGYFIVSGLSVSATNVCARIAWSKDYSKYVAYTAPSTVNLANVIAAIAATHSAVSDKMLAVGNVKDEATFSASSVAWTRRVSAISPTWTNTAIEGGYRHTAEIPSTNGAMKAGGYAEDMAGGVTLAVEGTTVSYEDTNATSSVVVKYELATVVTGTVSQSNSYTPNDMGLEVVAGCDGTFSIHTSYYQEVPDTIYALVSQVEETSSDVESIQADELGDAHIKSIDMDELSKVCGYSMFVFGTAAPTAAPDFIGQIYIDTTNKDVYMSAGVSSSSDYKKLN